MPNVHRIAGPAAIPRDALEWILALLAVTVGAAFLTNGGEHLAGWIAALWLCALAQATAMIICTRIGRNEGECRSCPAYPRCHATYLRRWSAGFAAVIWCALSLAEFTATAAPAIGAPVTAALALVQFAIFAVLSRRDHRG